MTSPREILEKLTACDFDALIGMFESEWLDAKETPYHLDAAPQKRELAKDVTALANAGGGVILLGFDCEKLPMTAGERINKVCTFPVSLVDPKRYNQILADLPRNSRLSFAACTHSQSPSPTTRTTPSLNSAPRFGTALASCITNRLRCDAIASRSCAS